MRSLTARRISWGITSLFEIAAVTFGVYGGVQLISNIFSFYVWAVLAFTVISGGLILGAIFLAWLVAHETGIEEFRNLFADYPSIPESVAWLVYVPVALALAGAGWFVIAGAYLFTNLFSRFIFRVCKGIVEA